MSQSILRIKGVFMKLVQTTASKEISVPLCGPNNIEKATAHAAVSRKLTEMFPDLLKSHSGAFSKTEGKRNSEFSNGCPA